MMDLSYWFQFWWMFPVALAICVTVNLIGVSGSVLFIPFYTFIFPLFGYQLHPIQIVQLGLFTETCGYASSSIAFGRQKLIDFRIALFALLFAVPMAILGSYLANIIPGSSLLLIVGLALVPLALLVLREARTFSKREVNEKDKSVLQESEKGQVHTDRQGRVYRYAVKNDGISIFVALLGGLFHGLVGFSAGEFNSTTQILRKVPVRIATGTAHLIIFGASLAAACTHIIIVVQQKGSIPWNILFMAVPAVLIGGQIAGLVVGRLPQHILQMVMGRFLIFVGFLSIYRALTAMNVYLPTWLILVACILFITSICLYFLPNKNKDVTNVYAKNAQE
jgi:uncharacterized membrane protein YfcA